MDDLERWLLSVNPATAERERFNTSITRLRKERPGSKSDRERKRQFAEAAELAKAREQQARWDAAVAENARKKERAENRRRAIEYKAHRAQRLKAAS